MSLRYGLIGAGMMGHEHIRNIHLHGGTVTGLADPDDAMRASAVAASGGGARGFAEHNALIAADICDAYVVASPNDLHHAPMLDLLKTDKPILCEKPFCTTSDHCRDLIAHARGRAAPVWVAMEYRYMPPVQRLIDERDKGTTGAPVMLSIREHRFPFLEKVNDWNRFNIRSGGTLVEKCCHFWDLMRLILQSDPVRAFASANIDVNHLDERYGGQVPDIIDNAYVIVDFANGTRGMLDLCMFAEGSEWQEVISLTGPRGRVDANIPGPARFNADGQERPSELVISGRQPVRRSRQTIDLDKEIMAAGDHHGSTYFQHQRFLEMVQTGHGRPEVSMEDGLWAVMVGEAAQRSARTGQAVALEGIG